MSTNNKLSKTILNLTTTPTNAYNTDSTQMMNNENLKTILSYAIPFSCLTIVIIIVFIIGVRQRHRVLDKWTSLKRMRNTNPKFLQSTGLRRDSEFDSYNRDHVNAISLSQENPLYKEQEYRLITIA